MDNERAETGHVQGEDVLAKRVKQLEAVRVVAEEITHVLDLPTLLALIIRRAVELVEPAGSGSISLWHETEQELVPGAWHNQGEWRRDVRLKLGEGIPGTVAQRREGMLLNDYRNSPYVNPLFVHHLGTTAVLAEPLVCHDRLHGVVTISNNKTGRTFTTQDREIIRLFAAQAAIALDNARLFAEVKTQTAQLEQANAVLHGEVRERQQAETALRQARDELESRVEARTAELRQANGQLQQEVTERQHAEEVLHTFTVQLQRSNRELQDFAYVASHDLQEPLRKIQSFGDRLQAKCSEAIGEQGLDYLRRMQNAAQRMQTLINDLLTFSRVTTKTQPFTPVDLTQVLREVMVDLEVRLEQTEGHIDYDELLTIDADPLQMRQLFQNLLGNALKFHRPAVAPAVTVRGHIVHSEEQSPDGHTPGPTLYQITVADNGIGFDEKYLDRLFNVFQRLHNRSAYEGTGLGLAVCRKIVERHGGRITAQSTPEQGATFIMTLPVTQSRGDEEHV